MAKSINFDESGDSAQLQAQFDAIAAGVPPALRDSMAAGDASGDNDELQALFDKVAAEVAAAATRPSLGDSRMFASLGRLLRRLHDTLRALERKRASASRGIATLRPAPGAEGPAADEAIDLLRDTEADLLGLLIESMPAEKTAVLPPDLLGAVGAGAARERVDELLRSLGF